MFSIFRREPPPPPPKPFYRKNPIATWAVVLTMIGMFVLGPVGVIYKTMAEELKSKANNETVLMYMKQQKETDDRQWKMIEQQVQRPQSVQMKEVRPMSEPKSQSVDAPPLTPKQFEDYMNMSPEHRAAFRKLHPAYANLPE